MATYQPKPTDTVESLRSVIDDLTTRATHMKTRAHRLKIDLHAELIQRDLAEKNLKAERKSHAEQRAFAERELKEYKEFAAKELQAERDSRAEYEQRMSQIISSYQFYSKVSNIRRETSGAKISPCGRNAREKDQQVLQTMLMTQDPEPLTSALDQVRHRQLEHATTTFTHDAEAMKRNEASSKENDSQNQNQDQRVDTEKNLNINRSNSVCKIEKNAPSRSLQDMIDSKRTDSLSPGIGEKHIGSQSYSRRGISSASRSSKDASERPSIPPTIEGDTQQLPVKSPIGFQSHASSPTKNRRTPTRREATIPPMVDPTIGDNESVQEAVATGVPVVVHEISDTLVYDTIPPTVNDEVAPTFNDASAPPQKYDPVYDNDPIPATIESGYDTTSPIKTRTPNSPGRSLMRRPSVATRIARASPTNNNRKKVQLRNSSDPDIDLGTLELRPRRADGSDNHRQSVAGANGQVYTMASRSESVQYALDTRVKARIAETSPNRGSKRRAVAGNTGYSAARASGSRGSKRRDVAVVDVGSSASNTSKNSKREKPIPSGNMIGGQLFVCTGVSSESKSRIKKQVLNNGGLWRDSVSARTHYLVAGKTLESGKSVRTSNKYKKALEHQTEIIDEAYFQQMVMAAELNDQTQMTP